MTQERLDKWTAALTDFLVIPYVVIRIAKFSLNVFKFFVTFDVNRLSLQEFGANGAIIPDTGTILWKCRGCWYFSVKPKKGTMKKNINKMTVARQIPMSEHSARCRQTDSRW